MFFLVSHAMAEAIYENEIQLESNSLILSILETYNLSDAIEFRIALDADNNSIVTESEINSFKESYLALRSPQFMEYIKIDNDNVTLYMNSISMDIYNATGNVTQAPLYVNTTIHYGITPELGPGTHSLWILGHPLIERMHICLPKGAILLSNDGLDNAITMKSLRDDSVALEGRSGIRSFMIGNRSTFEYATTVEFHKPHFYERGYFLPLLLSMELFLVVLAFYMKRKH
ncbi:MAG: hypothetical protein H5T43_08995 [Methanomethylovorans sp.]|nr:hypothetical protein [Methanomethylovorans sp.]